MMSEIVASYPCHTRKEKGISLPAVQQTNPLYVIHGPMYLHDDPQTPEGQIAGAYPWLNLLPEPFSLNNATNYVGFGCI